MYYYSKKELFKKIYLLVQEGARGELISFFYSISFVFRFIYFLFFFKEKKIVKIRTTKYGDLFIRTYSSDLEVFFQHFIYHELIQSELMCLKNINIILDLGANVGFASVVLARMYPDSKIIAVELEENNFILLKQNCAKLIAQERVIPILGAFYPQKGVDLRIVPGRLGDWNFSIAENGKDNNEFSVPVNIFTMDDIEEMVDGKNLDLIKMDIEGGEVIFLENDLWCNKVLLNSNLILELHSFKAYDLYFNQLRKNKIEKASQIGEYWLTEIKKVKKVNCFSELADNVS